jgi:hypothetical protein
VTYYLVSTVEQARLSRSAGKALAQDVSGHYSGAILPDVIVLGCLPEEIVGGIDEPADLWANVLRLLDEAREEDFTCRSLAFQTFAPSLSQCIFDDRESTGVDVK